MTRTRAGLVALLCTLLSAFLILPGGETRPAHAAVACVKDTTSGNGSRPALNRCVSTTPITIRIESGHFDGLRYEGEATLTVADGTTRNLEVFTFRDIGLSYHSSYPTNNLRITDNAAGYNVTMQSGDENTSIGSTGVYSTMYGEVNELHLYLPWCSLLNYSFAATWNWVSASGICDTTITAYAVHTYRAEATSASNAAPVDLRGLKLTVTP